MKYQWYSGKDSCVCHINHPFMLLLRIVYKNVVPVEMGHCLVVPFLGKFRGHRCCQSKQSAGFYILIGFFFSFMKTQSIVFFQEDQGHLKGNVCYGGILPSGSWILSVGSNAPLTLHCIGFLVTLFCSWHRSKLLHQPLQNGSMYSTG